MVKNGLFPYFFYFAASYAIASEKWSWFHIRRFHSWWQWAPFPFVSGFQPAWLDRIGGHLPGRQRIAEGSSDPHLPTAWNPMLWTSLSCIGYKRRRTAPAEHVRLIPWRLSISPSQYGSTMLLDPSPMPSSAVLFLWTTCMAGAWSVSGTSLHTFTVAATPALGIRAVVPGRAAQLSSAFPRLPRVLHNHRHVPEVGLRARAGAAGGAAVAVVAAASPAGAPGAQHCPRHARHPKVCGALWRRPSHVSWPPPRSKLPAEGRGRGNQGSPNPEPAGF
jgi:hypothetical protein